MTIYIRFFEFIVAWIGPDLEWQSDNKQAEQLLNRISPKEDFNKPHIVNPERLIAQATIALLRDGEIIRETKENTINRNPEDIEI